MSSSEPIVYLWKKGGWSANAVIWAHAPIVSKLSYLLVFIVIFGIFPSPSFSGSATAQQVNADFRKLTRSEILQYGKFTGGVYNLDGQAMRFCGGIAINKRWILTALHCVYKSTGNKKTAASYRPFSRAELRARKLQYVPWPLKAGDFHNILEVRVSRNFHRSSKTRFVDWALIRLDRDLPFHNYPSFEVPGVHDRRPYFLSGYPQIEKRNGKLDWDKYFVARRTSRPCIVAHTGKSRMSTDCVSFDVAPGLSGTAMITIRNGKPVVAGILSTRERRRIRGTKFIGIQNVTKEMLNLIGSLQESPVLHRQPHPKPSR